jgi:hypothetical protein
MPKTMRTVVLHGNDLGNLLTDRLENVPRSVLAAIVDDNDFVRDPAEPQFEVQMLNRRRNTFLFVTRGNDHRQKLQSRPPRVAGRFVKAGVDPFLI